MIRQRDFFIGELVHSRGDFFCLRAIVDEDECCSRRLNVLQHQRRDRRPDAPSNIAEISNWRLDVNLHFLGESAVHDRYRPESGRRAVGRAAAEKASDLVQRALRR